MSRAVFCHWYHKVCREFWSRKDNKVWTRNRVWAKPTSGLPPSSRKGIGGGQGGERETLWSMLFFAAESEFKLWCYMYINIVRREFWSEIHIEAWTRNVCGHCPPRNVSGDSPPQAKKQIYFSKSCIIVCNFKAFLRGLWEQIQFYVNHKHQHTENLKKHRKKQRTFRHTEKS